jgi:alanyl-tRNA synthetase
MEVTAREKDNAVVHVLEGRVESGPIEGEIDWARRFDHMQQHSGQHILSRAFIEVAGADTISFHLGADSVSIDLNVPALTDTQLSGAESLANDIVSRNLPVRAWFPEEAELAALPLRKRPEVAGPVRVVGIGDFDFNACGGTHVAATGEIGLIAVLRTEKLKRGTRIEFLCGHRARQDYARKHAIIRELSVALTCAPAELTGSLTRIRDQLQEARRELGGYQERELEQEADRLLAEAPAVNGRRVVVRGWDARPIEAVRQLALRMTTPPAVIALLGVAGERCQLVFARSEDIALDLASVFRGALDALGGGRGGGTRVLQGTAGAASASRLEEVLREAGARLPVGAG